MVVVVVVVVIVVGGGVNKYVDLVVIMIEAGVVVVVVFELLLLLCASSRKSELRNLHCQSCGQSLPSFVLSFARSCCCSRSCLRLWLVPLPLLPLLPLRPSPLLLLLNVNLIRESAQFCASVSASDVAVHFSWPVCLCVRHW